MSETLPPSTHLPHLCYSSPESPTRSWRKIFILHQRGTCLLLSLWAPYCFWVSSFPWSSCWPKPSTHTIPARLGSTRSLCKLPVGWALPPLSLGHCFQWYQEKEKIEIVIALQGRKGAGVKKKKDIWGKNPSSPLVLVYPLHHLLGQETVPLVFLGTRLVLDVFTMKLGFQSLSNLPWINTLEKKNPVVSSIRIYYALICKILNGWAEIRGNTKNW